MRLNTGRTSERVALRRDLGLGGLRQHRQPRVGKAHGLQRAHAEGVVAAGRSP